jgi:hypothetical protein
MRNKSMVDFYLEPGAFDPEAVAAMCRAFQGSVGALGVDDDEMRREAVAQFVIHLARWDDSLDDTALRERTVAALGGLRSAARKSARSRASGFRAQRGSH